MSTVSPGMSAYEAQAWDDLNEYWRRKSERRALPSKVSKAMEVTSGEVKDAATTTGGFIRDITPQPVRDAGGIALDWTLEPTIRAVVGLLKLVTEIVQEFTDAEKVFGYHRADGGEVDSLADLRVLDLKHLDAFTRTLTLRSRAIRVLEGSAMGMLTFIPVAGSVVAIPADLVVMHALLKW